MIYESNGIRYEGDNPPSGVIAKVDVLRGEANKLMQENPNLTYDKAYELANDKINGIDTNVNASNEMTSSKAIILTNNASPYNLPISGEENGLQQSN